MSTSVVILRPFSGLVPGQVVDTTDWVPSRAQVLADDRYLAFLESADAAKATECICGLLVLPDAGVHGCPELTAKKDAEKQARIEAAKAAAAEKAKTEQQQPKTEAPAQPTPSATKPEQPKTEQSKPTAKASA